MNFAQLNPSFHFLDWYLEYVEVDAPSVGLKWKFPCGRWFAKSKDDGQLERELHLATDEVVEYAAKVPYEITG